MASSGGIWVPMAQRVLRQALTAGARATHALRSHVGAAARRELEPPTVRPSVSPYTGRAARQPVHPAALRRRLKSSGAAAGVRWFSSAQASLSGAVRRFVRTAVDGRGRGPAPPRYVDRAAFLRTTVGTHAVWKTAGRAPFSSTLRPSLTGGALPRSAGGYALGGGGGASGARCFSHTPAASAQVVHNVSQAMRAFWLAGQRARFDGTDARGRPAYKAVSALEDDMARRLAVPPLPPLAPGAFVAFSLSPTITALGAVSSALVAAGLSARKGPSAAGAAAAAAAAAATATLRTEGFLDVLGVDFARALQELSAVMNDLKRLAALGDLPVLLDQGGAGGRAPALRVRFPGVDADTVERLCADLGVTRGVVGQDPGFDRAVGADTALRFPFAPDADADAELLTSPGGSLRSRVASRLEDSVPSDVDDLGAAYFDVLSADNPWLSEDGGAGDGCASLSPPVLPPPSPASGSGEHMSQDFEGLEGVYRFLAACDRASVRF